VPLRSARRVSSSASNRLSSIGAHKPTVPFRNRRFDAIALAHFAGVSHFYVLHFFFMTALPPALTEAVSALWRIPPPGPNNLLSARPFVHLRDTCNMLFPNSKDEIGFGLANALHALGLPCHLPAARANLGLPAQIAAVQLNAAFPRKDAKRLYLCPLDLADPQQLPQLIFGPNCVRRFTPTELEAAVDLPRLRRIFPSWTFDAATFSHFCWLVVEETYSFDHEPGQRAMPILFERSEDWDRIDPHRERLPPAVQRALFALLRAPWEEWVRSPKHDWRGFNIPWVHVTDDDIFVRTERPPSADTLSWEPNLLEDEYGDLLETVALMRYSLKDTVSEASNRVNDAVWSAGTRALRSPLFETPIAHFFVRAFLSEPLDEFLAHMTTIEAAMGLRADYSGKSKAKIAGVRKLTPTHRVAKRVAALLGAKAHGDEYVRLFDHRSNFLHSRPMGSIPSDDRITARGLARKVVNGLVEAALSSEPPQSRENYLDSLLAQGISAVN
jgi:hypothetical protein